MQDLEELLAQMADARKIYGKEPVAPYHGGNRVSGSSAGSRVDAARAEQHASRQPARTDLHRPGGQAPGSSRSGLSRRS